MLNSDAEQSQSSMAVPDQQNSVAATASTDAAHSESAQQSVQEDPEPAQEPEEAKKELAAAPDDGLPLVEETKEVAESRRSQREEDEEGDVTDDSFRCANLSLMPEDADNAALANVLPAMKIKAELQPSKLKLVNMPMMPLNRVQRNLQDGDLQKLAGAVTMEVNQMAAQLFELISMLNEVIAQKPKRVFRQLASEQQKRTE